MDFFLFSQGHFLDGAGGAVGFFSVMVLWVGVPGFVLSDLGSGPLPHMTILSSLLSSTVRVDSRRHSDPFSLPPTGLHNRAGVSDRSRL